MSTHLFATFSRALQDAGAPSHVVEARTGDLMAALGRDGAIVASPTAIWLEVDTHSRVLRQQPGEPDLERLTALYAWHRDTLADPGDPDAAQARLDALLARPARYGARAKAAAFAVASAGAGWLIGGSAPDLVFAGLGGLLVWLALGRLTDPSWRPLASVAIGVLAGVLGALAGQTGADPAAVALASLIVVVPGMGMTVALAEVAMGHWSSGSARLLGAFASAAQLAVGLAIGGSVLSVLPAAPSAPILPGSGWIVPVLAPPAFAVLLAAAPRQIPAVTAISAAGFAADATVGGPLGAGAGALLVGLLANALTRTRGIPALATSLPGTLLLLPGSVGVRGMGLLLGHDPVSGAQTAVDALTGAGALVLGLLLSHAVFPAQAPGVQYSSSPSAATTASRSRNSRKAAVTSSSAMSSSGGPHSASSASVP